MQQRVPKTMVRPKDRLMRTNRSSSKVPVTSSWSVPIPTDYARIGISRGPPRRQHSYRMYAPLAPGAWFKSVTPAEFHRRYMAQLAKLDPSKVLRDLADIAGDQVPTLLCFEALAPNEAWCHRGLVSVWFAETLGVKVVEFGHETAGWGWTHPKLPAKWRRAPRRTR
jgi:uncharacterized protein DUF488